MNAQDEESNLAARYQKLLQGLESEPLLVQKLIDIVPDHVFQKDREGRYVAVNRSMWGDVGVSGPQDIIGKTDREIFPPETAEKFISDDMAVFASGNPLFNIEESFICASGSRKWVLTTKVPLFDGSNHIHGIMGIGRDITVRKELEKENQKLAMIVKYADDAIVGFDLNRRITAWSTGAERLYGYTAEEMIGTPTSMTIPPELEDEARLMRERLMQGEQFVRYETARLHKDGSRIMVSITLSTTLDEHGTPVGVASTARDITERKKAQESLQDSERRLADIIDFLPDATFAIDRQGRVIIWNKAIEKMTGILASEMMGKGDSAYALPFYGEQRAMLVDLVLRDKAEVEARYSNITCEGDTFSTEVFCGALCSGKGAWVFAKVSPLRDQSGAITGAIESIRDITVRRGTGEALRESEQRLSEIVDFLPDATFAIDTEGTVTAWNRAIEQMTGKSKDQMLGCGNFEYAIPYHGCRCPILIDFLFDNREEIKKRYAFVERRGDTLYTETFTPLLNEGKGAYLWGIATFLRNEKGKVVGAIESIRDVTDRKRAEEALRESEGRYRSIVENALDAILLIDEQGAILAANPAACRMFGRTEAELCAMGASDLVDPEESRSFTAREETARTGRFHGELIHMRRDGSRFPAEVTSAVFSGSNGRKAICSIIRDISAQAAAQARIRFQAQLLHEVSQAVIATDLDGRVLYWNRAAVDLYGWTEEEVLGKEIAQLLAYQFKALANGGTESRERLVRDKRGRVLPVYMSNSPILDESGIQTGVFGISFDLTERKKAEEALRQSEERFQQSQKMEAVGRLAGGIAHDFNNLLTVIRGYCEILSEKAEESVRGDVRQIQQAAQRATTLTAQLLAFSRKQILQPRVISLPSIVADMREMLQRLIGEDVVFTIRSSGDEWLTLADPGRIEQVIMNLAVNARDAMPAGGMLTIGTSNALLNHQSTALNPEAREGEYVLLEVSDTGQGMDKVVLSHVFEPFFTTKEKGKGTGLGLATVYGMIKQSNGFVLCNSEPGKGTTFRIYLPRSVEEKEQAAASSKSVSHPQGGAELILLVEDDDGVRSLAQSILGRAGYAVVAARTGFEAIAALSERRGCVDLLITDVVMPGMNGREVAQHVAVQCPSAKVVYMSGYTEDTIVHHGVLDRGVRLIQKPFSAAELLRAVREALA